MIGKNKIIMELNNEVKELRDKNRELESEILLLKETIKIHLLNWLKLLKSLYGITQFIMMVFYSSKKSKEKSKPIINIKSIYGIPYDEDREEFNGLKGNICR